MKPLMFRRKTPEDVSRWRRVRQLAGLAALCEAARLWVDQRGSPLRPEWQIPGTESSRRYSRSRHSAQLLAKANDHYELTLLGGRGGRTERKNFFAWKDIPGQIGGHSGLLILYVNGKLVYRGRAPEWDARHWQAYLFGDHNTW